MLSWLRLLGGFLVGSLLAADMVSDQTKTVGKKTPFDFIFTVWKNEKFTLTHKEYKNFVKSALS